MPSDLDALIPAFGHNNNDVYRTALGSLPALGSQFVQLTDHYRSHPLIIGFSNINIYHKSLQLLRRKSPESTVESPGVFGIDVPGTAQRGSGGASWVNSQEAEAVVAAVDELRQDGLGATASIGVVTPFKAQKELIDQLLEKAGLKTGVLVGTVHTFQGDERDIMVFSPVVATGMGDGAARWVEAPPNLINVAVTRARDAFFLVADFRACKRQPGLLGKLARYVEKVERIRKSSAAELEFYSLMVTIGIDPEHHRVVADIEVDFVIEANGVKLAIEIDGPSHDFKKQVVDQARDAALRTHGYKPLRLVARDVFEKPADVTAQVEEALKTF